MSEDESKGSFDTKVQKTAALPGMMGENNQKDKVSDKEPEAGNSEEDSSEEGVEEEEDEEKEDKNEKDKGDDSDEDDDKDNKKENVIKKYRKETNWKQKETKEVCI